MRRFYEAYPEMLWVCPLAKEVLDSPENTTDTIGSTVATQIQIPTDSSENQQEESDFWNVSFSNHMSIP